MEYLDHIFSTLAEAFGPVGALFVIIAGYLLRELLTEYKNRREDDRETVKALTMSQITAEKMLAIIEKR